MMVLIQWIPAGIDHLGRDGRFLRIAALGLIAGIVVVHLRISPSVIDQQNIELPGGFVSSGDRAIQLKSLLADLQALQNPRDTLAVAPEGCWINFITEMRNPTPDELLNPVGMIRSGDDAVVERDYLKSPPTWFIIIQQDTKAFGRSPFGKGYARGLQQLIDRQYDRIALFGPAQSGMILFKHHAK